MIIRRRWVGLALLAGLSAPAAAREYSMYAPTQLLLQPVDPGDSTRLRFTWKHGAVVTGGIFGLTPFDSLDVRVSLEIPTVGLQVWFDAATPVPDAPEAGEWTAPGELILEGFGPGQMVLV